jgi:hypothetical protein
MSWDSLEEFYGGLLGVEPPGKCWKSQESAKPVRLLFALVMRRKVNEGKKRQLTKSIFLVGNTKP